MLTVLDRPAALFLDPPDFVARTDKIAVRLKKEIEQKKSPDFLAAAVYYLALKAQIKVLNYLNEDNFFCQAPWDLKTDLPSHPSLAADVVKYGELFDAPFRLRAFLCSFSGWTLFNQEILKGCRCRVAKGENVSLDVMANAILSVKDASLTVKLLVGIKSDNLDHLIKHYGRNEKNENATKQSRVDDQLYIIYICENRIIVNGEEIFVEPISYFLPENKETFDIKCLEEIVWRFIPIVE